MVAAAPTLVDELPELDWSIPAPSSRLDYGFHSASERADRKAIVAPRVNSSRLSAKENLVTPPAFRDVLLDMARSCASTRNGTPEAVTSEAVPATEGKRPSGG